MERRWVMGTPEPGPEGPGEVPEVPAEEEREPEPEPEAPAA